MTKRSRQICELKVKYYSKKKAEKQAERHSETFNCNMSVYKCPHGSWRGHYHLTTKSNK